MDQQERKKYLFVKCASEDIVRNFLVSWRYDDHFDIKDGVVISSSEKDLFNAIINVLSGEEYGILISLSDHRVFICDYKMLSMLESTDKIILPYEKELLNLDLHELKCPLCEKIHYAEKSLWEEILKYDEKGDQCDDCVAEEYADHPVNNLVN